MEVMLIDESTVAHAALSPLRLDILRRLTEPASASELARDMDESRQKINYHLKLLAGHGLVTLIGERPRRGFVEHLYQRRGDVVLAPDLIAAPLSDRDAIAADAVVAAATDAIRAVGNQTRAAAAAGLSLPTAALTTDISFETPDDMMRFMDGVARLAARFDTVGEPGRTMRITVLSHPRPERQP